MIFIHLNKCAVIMSSHIYLLLLVAFWLQDNVT